MKTFLVEGFTDAYSGLGAALRLFWPVLAVLLLGYSSAFSFGYMAVAAPPPADSLTMVILFLVIGLCAGLYMFFMLCQGAVGWHRMLLLGDVPGWISPLPRRRAFQYALAVFLFGLVFLIAHLLIGSLALPFLHSFLTSSLSDIDMTNASVDQLEAWRKAVWPIQIAMLVVAVILFWVILLLTKSWLLIFPHISIRAGHPAFGQIRESLVAPVGLIGALLVSYFLPSVLAFVYDFLTPMQVQFMTWVWVPAILVQFALSVICFLAGLSILSKAYAKAAKGKVPYERTGDAAPA